MLIYEYKLDARKEQYVAIDNAIRVTQFIRNKCIRLWMDTRGITKNDLQIYCSTLAAQFPFAKCLNSQARQAAADRAWSSIQRFFDNCKNKKPGKKGYPQFQHDNRSVEYKQTGWKLDPDGRHITFTDDCNMVKNHHLAKCISDASWGTFLSWVNYYGGLHNVPVIAVAPQFTSQDCSACGTRVKKSLSVRTHMCHSCGLVMDRDQNAALNILEKASRTVGHTETARADGALENASGHTASTHASQGV